MICLDSSVAVKLVIDEEQSDRAWDLYRSTLVNRRQIVAPPLLPLEVTNVVRQQMRGANAISLLSAAAILDDFLALSIAIHYPPGLHAQALVLATGLGLPATYDAHYLALADILDCDFWAADLRLFRQARDDLPFVRWLGDHSPATAQ